MDITNDPAATPAQRIEALRAGVADEHFPSWVPESNNHIHTCFSFSPYTPTHAALLARRNGLRVVGSAHGAYGLGDAFDRDDELALAAHELDGVKTVGDDHDALVVVVHPVGVLQQGL